MIPAKCPSNEALGTSLKQQKCYYTKQILNNFVKNLQLDDDQLSPDCQVFWNSEEAKVFRVFTRVQTVHQDLEGKQDGGKAHGALV